MYLTIMAVAVGACAVIFIVDGLLVRAARRRATVLNFICKSSPPVCRMLQPGTGVFDSATGEEVETDEALRERIAQTLWDGHIDEAKQHSAELRRRADKGSKNHD